ncbi:anti-sigma factor domain-containing protein [Pseudarthrobacter sulfonivorans]|uniref:anti-sigma factor n=1 Tax=Pseudarthrobacter sulfonivorans TaxID=121292 RepID=UPI0028576508|nr:anti-sigma factor [Pseudarthrobacter sulfonivorans]MDR6413795.1 anti-sigma-K factor RskA [Pseudarthrobacter sulfonivorans]
MTEINSQGGPRRPGSFGLEIASDLDSGRAVDLAELYALDAVSEDERAAIDRYISTAPEAERNAFLERVRQARETLAMSFTAQEEPPADLFARIVSQLPSLAQLPAGDSAEQASVSAAVPAAGHPQAETTDELSAARLRRESRRRPAGARRWLAAAAAAAVIALGGVAVGSYVADQNDPLNQVVRAEDVREASVPVAAGGTATVLISSSRDALVVKMNGVPAPPAGKVYQMWLIPKDGSAPVSQGLMDEAALSKPAVVKGIASAAALGITVEPVGGSAAPTFPTVAAAPLGA